uniref:Glycine cleavage system H protein n=1 Tax=Syphacia muris TaxID=451379 RepID=A0A0N5ANI5_9BILA
MDTYRVFRMMFLARLSSLSSVVLASSQRRYTKKHEWISVEDKVGIVGISEYALLGDIVYVELPEPDTELKAGDTAAAVESVKAASDVYSPVSGIVTARNTELEDKPALINKSCYEKGWIYKMTVKEPSELEELMDENAYKAFVKKEEEASH